MGIRWMVKVQCKRFTQEHLMNNPGSGCKGDGWMNGRCVEGASTPPSPLHIPHLLKQGDNANRILPSSDLY